MSARWFVRSLATAALLGILAPGAGVAANPCMTDARQQAFECQAQCREDYQLARDGCFNRDHECVERCRAERELCVEATGIAALLDACQESVRAAKAICRELHAADSPALDLCIDQAQVIGFQCRDQARESVRPALDACHEAFRTCARACPPPDPPSEAIDPTQCRRDAKAAYRLCKSGCREESQFQRDACRNRDHDCVEACRAGRETCHDPIDAQLDAALVLCAVDRDAAVENCRTLFADGSTELDQCLDNAQVAHFQCRDQAREAARPGREACSDQFRACARSCPPAP